jgi:hypothetical protein
MTLKRSWTALGVLLVLTAGACRAEEPQKEKADCCKAACCKEGKACDEKSACCCCTCGAKDKKAACTDKGSCPCAAAKKVKVSIPARVTVVMPPPPLPAPPIFPGPVFIEAVPPPPPVPSLPPTPLMSRAQAVPPAVAECPYTMTAPQLTCPVVASHPACPASAPQAVAYPAPPRADGWRVRVSEADGKSRLEVQAGHGDETVATCEGLVLKVGGDSVKVAVAGKQVRVCGSHVKATADSVIRGPEGRLILQGSVKVSYSKDGHKAEVSAEHVTVGVTDGYLNVTPAAPQQQVIQFWMGFFE